MATNNSNQPSANQVSTPASPGGESTPPSTPTTPTDEEKAKAAKAQKAADAKEAEEKAKADSETAERQAALDKREAELAEREKSVSEKEAAPGRTAALTQNEITQQQLKDSEKILNGPTKKVTLKYEHTNVTPAGALKYGPGEVEVPEPFAEDLERRDAEHNSYQVGLHQRRENILYSGTISGAGK